MTRLFRYLWQAAPRNREVSMADNDKGDLHEMQEFKLGELPGGEVAVLIGYATSAEKLAKSDVESFVIGMTRHQANELGKALVAFATRPLN
jgi:hypothetical protein